MHKTIGNRDLLLMLWAVLSMIALFRDLLQTGVFALRKFKSLAAVTGLSAAVSLTIMWFGIDGWGAPRGPWSVKWPAKTINLGRRRLSPGERLCRRTRAAARECPMMSA